MSNTCKVVDTESFEKEAVVSKPKYLPMHNNPFPDEVLKHDPSAWKRIRTVRGKMTSGTLSEMKL